MKKRASFTLIEVLISLTLFAVLFSVMFGLFSHYTLAAKHFSKKRKTHEEALYFQTRLQQAFSNTVFQPKYHPYFYIEENALVFTFKDTLTSSESQTSVSLAKLYRTDEGITLAVWPHPPKIAKEYSIEPKKELLLKNVKHFSIEFFKAAKANNQKEEKYPTKKWVDYWPEEYGKRPTLVKLTCDDTTYFFLIARETEAVEIGS